MSIYEGQTNLRINLDTEFPNVDVKSVVWRYITPNGTHGEWTGIQSEDDGNGNARTYKDDFAANELVKGIWQIQPIITDNDDKIIPCKIYELEIENSI